jgi:diadenosine tetraphosphatase ApaH/serine/threonine PP2A family protein phosphatase
MRLGIFTDVHSNFEALKAVALALKSEKIDRLIFLGDAVGYGADPNDCCRIIREMAHVALVGNHDAALTGRLPMDWFVDYAREAIEWTEKVINPSHREWLSTRPFFHREEGIGFCHGSPVDPERFGYVIDINEVFEIWNWMEDQGIPMVFVGHAHIGLAFRHNHSRAGKKDEIKIFNFNGVESSPVRLDPECTWVINVGAVGQPRDGDPRAVYAVFDTETWIYEVQRVKYDIKSASGRIEKAGLPSILSERLFVGR